MGKLIIIGLITAILALTALYAFDPTYRQARSDAALFASQREQAAIAVKATQTALDLQQQQIDAQIDAQRSQQLAPAWTGLTIWTFVLIGLAMGVAVVAGAMFCIVFLARRAVLVRPDAQGMLPMPLAGFDRLATSASASLGAYHIGRIENARHQPGQTPHSVSQSTHYAPNFTRSITADATRFPDGSSLDAAPMLGAGVPSFAELLDQGKIGRNNPITIGFDSEGKAFETDWKGLYSSAIGGRQGSGKSWTAANIIAQSVLHGARLVICDIHAGDDESISNRIAPLSSAFLFDTADSPKSVITAVRNLDAMLTARSDGKDKSRGIILLVFDEFTSTLRRLGKDSEAVSSILANVASEGRKFGIFALLIGHNWNAESTGGTEVRDNLTSAMVHNLRPNEARMMTGLTAASLPADTHSLQPGQYYLLPKSGDMVKVQSPFMTDNDMHRVGQLLLGDGADSLYDLGRSAVATPVDESEPASTENVPNINRMSTAVNPVDPATQAVKLVSPEASEVKRLFFAENLDPSEIVYRLYGVKGNQGQRYQTYLKEVHKLLRA